MIIVKMMGGLGNQLFQYCLGRRLADINNTNLKLDINWYQIFLKKSTTRVPFFLHEFNINAKIATKNEIFEVIRFGPVGYYALRPVTRISPWVAGDFLNYYREKAGLDEKPDDPKKRPYTGYFNEKVLNVKDDSYLHGYWATEKYFKDTRSDLLNELTVKKPINGMNKQILTEINEVNSVAIHVRLGDNIGSGETLPIEYYEKSLNYVEQSIANPEFFGFSDNPKLAQSLFEKDYDIQFVTCNDYHSPEEDLRLMKSCDHNIISNSTFSWWGAWLNPNQDKIVTAPNPWKPWEHWANAGIQESWDLIPSDWQEIEYTI